MNNFFFGLFTQNFSRLFWKMNLDQLIRNIIGVSDAVVLIYE